MPRDDLYVEEAIAKEKVRKEEIKRLLTKTIDESSIEDCNSILLLSANLKALRSVSYVFKGLAKL